MKKVKILHTADIHIGAAESFLGNSADSRRFETLITFEKIMELAARENVSLVALAGDIFDSNTVEPRFADAVFDKIAAFPQIKTVFAAGNHDPLDSSSPFLLRSLPDNLYVLGVKDECIVFDDLKLNVFGRSFENAYLKGEEKLNVLLPDNGYINLLVQHGELKSDLRSDYNAITPSFVKNSKMDYIALGHVHARTEIGKIAGTYFAYCGCPEGQGFDELDQKGVYIGEIGKGECNLQFVPVARRSHIHEKIDITGVFSAEEICGKILSMLEEKYGENYADNLYKIELTGEIPENFEIITTEITSRLADRLYFVKVKDSTEFSCDYEALALEPTLKGIFVKKMLQKIENADPSCKDSLEYALKLGIKAFNTEVKYNED